MTGFGIALVAFGAGWLVGGRRTTHILRAPSGSGIAYVLETPCMIGRCESLWVGIDDRHVTHVESLSLNDEHCDEIAWTPDAGRVAFLINGYQLRVFDAHTGKNLGAIAIVDPDGFPPSRIARGVTFSTNGASVTFDNCPRDRSGCKPGFAAIKP
jgi:hypothetical protein